MFVLRFLHEMTRYREHCEGKILTGSDQNVAIANRYFGAEEKSLQERIALEEYATDSFQNIQLSLLLFMNILGRPPSQLTIISHEFKRKRFLSLHCHALRWPADRVGFCGIDPPMSPERHVQIEVGNRKACEAWTRHPFGTGHDLSQKRAARGWLQHRTDTEEGSSEDDALAVYADIPGALSMLQWDGGESESEPYPGYLPWE